MCQQITVPTGSFLFEGNLSVYFHGSHADCPERSRYLLKVDSLVCAVMELRPEINIFPLHSLNFPLHHPSPKKMLLLLWGLLLIWLYC